MIQGIATVLAYVFYLLFMPFLVLKMAVKETVVKVKQKELDRPNITRPAARFYADCCSCNCKFEYGISATNMFYSKRTVNCPTCKTALYHIPTYIVKDET